MAVTEAPVASPPTPAASRGRQAVSGAVASLAALGAAELVAGLLSEVPSLLDAVGTFVIDSVPPGVKDAAISIFGTNDKTALLVGSVLVIAGIGAVVGLLAARWMGWGIIAFGVFGVAGAMSALRIPDVPAVGVWLTAAAAALVGIAVLAALLRLSAPPADRGTDRGRRAFIAAAGSVVALAALAAAGGRFLADQARRMLAGREDVVLPAAAETVAAPPGRASFQIQGLSPLVTPNAEFYRIDTALTVPRVDLTTWRLGFTGMVNRPFEVDFLELIDMPMVERHITIACVSNEVGGDLIGTAKWLGVPLPVLLERAGVQPGATQIVGRSADGFTVGFPTEVALDGRDTMVAVGMNGEPLPFEHGFPARLIVAGLYGYVSATKWLTEVELATWDGFDAYWVPRGWSKEAPIKTQSRDRRSSGRFHHPSRPAGDSRRRMGADPRDQRCRGAGGWRSMAARRTRRRTGRHDMATMADAVGSDLGNPLDHGPCHRRNRRNPDRRGRSPCPRRSDRLPLRRGQRRIEPSIGSRSTPAGAGTTSRPATGVRIGHRRAHHRPAVGHPLRLPVFRP